MRKVWLVVALVALGSLAANSFADVQNIRISGDIRLRGYYLDNAGDNQTYDAFISQRTRVSVEADLEDHVLAVVTFKAEGLWGGIDGTETGAEGGPGASGAGQNGGGVINRGFGVGIDEAYVQLNEVFYSAATLKLGRQYLNYGHGLIFSSVDQEYNFDAARLVLDYYPLTIDVVGARLGGVSPAVFGAPFGPSSNQDVIFLNARYEMTDSLLKDIEVYYGDQIRTGSSTPAAPEIIGVRADLNLTEGLSTWGEAAYEFGDRGLGAGGGDISAWLLNVGASFGLKNSQWSPTVNASWTYASGGAPGSSKNFVPWFDYVNGYNGYLFAPMLSNIHIFNLGGSIKPYENTTLSLQGYYYMRDSSLNAAGSNPNIDFGGISAVNLGTNKEIGWEVDTILGYDYSKDVHCQLVYAFFIPGHSDFVNGGATGFDSVAHELRGELNVKF